MATTDKLMTPFGEIKILIDGASVPYQAEKGRDTKEFYSDLLGRYQITIQYVPDGTEHRIACVFDPTCPFENAPESGDRLECQGFYNEDRFKMSIGLECEIDLFDEEHPSGDYDYGADYLDNGMEYIIRPDTKTETYKFGIAWIDDVGFKDPIDPEKDREVQTWFGADPTYPL